MELDSATLTCVDKTMDSHRQDGPRGLANILYLAHRTPFPPNRGDRIRSYHTLRFLAERSNVYLAALSDEPVTEKQRTALSEVSVRYKVIRPHKLVRWTNGCLSFGFGKTATEGLFHSTELARLIRNWSAEVQFDAVMAFCSSMAQYFLRPDFKSLPCVVDLVDVDSKKWLEYSAAKSGMKSMLYKREAYRLQSFERRLTDHARAVLLVSEAEAEIHRTNYKNDKTIGVPNGVDIDYFRPDEIKTPSTELVFVGVLNYFPNVSGLQWFCTNVWPRVTSLISSAKLTIVGRNPNAEVLRLADHTNVQVVGEVPDVRPYISRSQVVVVPLKIARGIQNKVLEAMAMGKPVVASPEALYGLELNRHQDVICAHTVDEWTQALEQLFRNQQRCIELGQHARNYVEQKHSWSACLQPLEELLLRNR